MIDFVLITNSVHDDYWDVMCWILQEASGCFHSAELQLIFFTFTLWALASDWTRLMLRSIVCYLRVSGPSTWQTDRPWWISFPRWQARLYPHLLSHVFWFDSLRAFHSADNCDFLWTTSKMMGCLVNNEPLQSNSRQTKTVISWKTLQFYMV